MTSSDENRVVDDALGRLVRSVVGQDDPASLDLARQILESSVGDRAFPRSISSTWNRIERSTDRSTRKEVQQLYEKLKQVSDPKLAEEAIVVLSKVASNDINNKVTSKHYTPNMSTNQKTLVNDSVEKLTGDRLILAKQVERDETLLLRECLYALQGMDGEHIRYYWSSNKQDSKEDGIRVRINPLLESVALDPAIPSRMGSGSDDALRICGEAGWLHHEIQTYIQQGDMSRGMVSRALAGALASKLQDYYALLSSIEADITTSGLTLRQLLIELQQPTWQLRTLAMVTDGVSHLSGGQLLSALYQHSMHGDTRHASLVQHLLSRASEPWYQLLYLWTTHGELVDPHHEFFIEENGTVDDKHLWSHRYTIREDQIIPNGILDQDLVRPAWILGKGINFIRKCLLDTEWRLDLGQDVSEDFSNDEKRKILGYHNRGRIQVT